MNVAGRKVRALRCVGGVVGGVVAMVCVGASAGCAGGFGVGVEDLAAARAQATTLRDELVGEADAIRAGGVPEGSPAREASLRERAADIDRAIRSLDAVAAEAEHPQSPITRGVSELSALLPEPARSPVVLGGALLAMLVRARQLKTALASVARSMDRRCRTIRSSATASRPTRRRCAHSRHPRHTASWMKLPAKDSW